jgi:hypothetical protein
MPTALNLHVDPDRKETRIQPPGYWHLVYTPVKGMVSGGHFLSYETLHLTEMACAYDGSENADGVLRKTLATNSAHDISRRVMSMMLALPDLVHTRSRSSLTGRSGTNII